MGQRHQHKDAAMRELLRVRSEWLTVVRLPPYAPHLNPVEGVRAHLKGPSPASPPAPPANSPRSSGPD
ncbi:transposase [Streptomyces sp. NPDC126514]|uniref:transposase n=1 Tax=Streptomyces sp. NPDC126514 TaxID=3155210 RepID=UPI0033192535